MYQILEFMEKAQTGNRMSVISFAYASPSLHLVYLVHDDGETWMGSRVFNDCTHFTDVDDFVCELWATTELTRLAPERGG